MICKNIPRDHSWRAVVSFLRSYRLTGRLTVFFILVKPFADVVCGYVYHDQENEFSYDLQQNRTKYVIIDVTINFCGDIGRIFYVI